MQGRTDEAQKGSTAVKESNVNLSLLGDDVPESREEHAHITSQQAQVEAVMADGRAHTLPGLVVEIKQRFHRLCQQPALSARLRDMRPRGWEVKRERVTPGSNLWQYTARKLSAEEIAARKATTTYADQVFGNAAA